MTPEPEPRAAALLAHVDAHDARADALHGVADHARIGVEQSRVVGSGRSAGTLGRTFGVKRQNWDGEWGGVDHCGDMVTGARARKNGVPARRASLAELATFKQMAQIAPTPRRSAPPENEGEMALTDPATLSPARPAESAGDGARFT